MLCSRRTAEPSPQRHLVRVGLDDRPPGVGPDQAVDRRSRPVAGPHGWRCSVRGPNLPSGRPHVMTELGQQHRQLGRPPAPHLPASPRHRRSSRSGGPNVPRVTGRESRHRGRRGTARRSAGSRRSCSSGAGARMSRTYDSSASSSDTSRPCRSTGTSGARGSGGTSRRPAACRASTAGWRRSIGSKRWSSQRTAAMFSGGAVAGAGLQLGAEAADVVEQPTGLVLPRPQAGQGEQALLVVAALDDAGHEAQPLPVLVGDDLHLADVEARARAAGARAARPSTSRRRRTPRSPSARATGSA